jgi:hypothetical protein
MHPHEKWLELAALDAIGQLPAAERDALLEHLRSCHDCVNETQALSDVTQNWLPVASSTRAPLFGRNEREGRAAFIKRAQAEGLRFSAQAKRPRGTWFPGARSWNAALAGAAVAAVCSVFVFTMVRAHVGQAPQAHLALVVADDGQLARDNQQLQAQLASAKGQLEAEHNRVASLEEVRGETSRRFANLEQQLAISRKQASDAREQLSLAVANSAEEAKRLAADLRQLDSLRAELEQTKSARAADQASLVDERYKLAELTEQLRTKNASVDRDRELMAASRDIRDVMSARNLHIVDVHDIAANGKQRKAFGRMFYTEGKSLIFYAYDLDTKGVKNASFQVWGQKTDDQRAAVSLGMLYTDDQRQSRWLMKFDDPKVLAEIDSVFVTVESHGGSKKPSGKKMMYAYLLSNANHP